jgi:hypothetical protein
MFAGAQYTSKSESPFYFVTFICQMAPPADKKKERRFLGNNVARETF